MSIEKRKLFHFVSKLIFDTQAGDLKWMEDDTVLEESPILSFAVPRTNDVFSTKTPDEKKIILVAIPDEDMIRNDPLAKHYSRRYLRQSWTKKYFKDIHLQLLGPNGKKELFLSLQYVNSLATLCQIIIRSIDPLFDEEFTTPAAEQTIDLILNSNKETTPH